jgi:membrane protein
MTKSKSFFKLFIKKLQADGVGDIAALLAYYFLLSIFPFLLFVLALIPYFSIKEGAVLDLISSYAPGQTGKLIISNVKTVLSQPKEGLLSIGLIATLWSGSNGISALVRSINQAYSESDRRSFFMEKLIALVFTVSMVGVIVITLLLPVFGQLIFRLIEVFIELPQVMHVLYQIFRWAVGILSMLFVLTLLYYFAPKTRVRIRDVLWGAFFATTVWQLISLAFSFYLSNFENYSATYGTLGGVIILMLWFYLTGLILIVGGEINATLYQLKHRIDSDLT